MLHSSVWLAEGVISALSRNTIDFQDNSRPFVLLRETFLPHFVFELPFQSNAILSVAASNFRQHDKVPD